MTINVINRTLDLFEAVGEGHPVAAVAWFKIGVETAMTHPEWSHAWLMAFRAEEGPQSFRAAPAIDKIVRSIPVEAQS